MKVAYEIERQVTSTDNRKGWHIRIGGAYWGFLDMSLDDVIGYFGPTHLLNVVNDSDLGSGRLLDITAFRTPVCSIDVERQAHAAGEHRAGQVSWRKHECPDCRAAAAHLGEGN